jgi:hypothetical protein
MHLKTVALVGAFFFSLIPAKAQQAQQPNPFNLGSANDLLEICKSENALSRSFCRGYIRGVADTLQGTCAVAIPGGFSNKDLADLIVANLALQIEMFPDKGKLPTQGFVAYLLREAFAKFPLDRACQREAQ